MKILADWFPTEHCESTLRAAGVERYHFISQNELGPKQGRDLPADVGPMIDYARKQHEASPETKYAMLDVEGEGLDTVLSAGPDHPRYAAVVKWERDLLATMRKEIPGLLWTYFGGPALNEFSGTPSRFTVDRDRPARAAYVRAMAENWKPVLSLCDYTQPCIYLASEMKTVDQALRQMRQRRLRITAAHLAAPGKPCIPAICPNGCVNIPEWILLTDAQWLLSQVMAAIDNDCDGVAIWTGWDYYSLCATPLAMDRKDEMRAAFATNWGESCLTSQSALQASMGGALERMAILAKDVLSDARPRLAGDTDGDGVVGAKDLANVTGNWGKTSN